MTMTHPTTSEQDRELLAPMVLPACEQHGQMELQKPGTKEQEYCGTWYRCSRCGSSHLFPSPDLRRDLSRAAIAKGEKE